MREELREFWFFFKQNRGAVGGLVLIGLFMLAALFAPLLSHYDPAHVFPDALRLPPFWVEGGKHEFLLGTDDVGRDILSRLLYGARVSLGVGFLVVLLSL